MTKNKSEAGQILILAVLSLVVLMGLLGMGIDVGYLRHMRTKMQQAADAAALAGASELNYGDWAAAADNDAASNGFTDGSNGTTITVNKPPANGGYAGNSSAVEVIIQQPQPTFFMSVLGFTKVNVAGRAVAYSGANSKNCLIALGADANAGMIINVGANVDLFCGVADNSALSIAGNLTAPLIGAVGGISRSSPSTNPITPIPPASDPLAYLQNNEPATTPCGPPIQVSPNQTCTLTRRCVINGTGNYTVGPGVYCGGLEINGTPNVTFSSGTYVMSGTYGLQMNGTVTGGGSNVTIYNTGTGKIVINGGSDFALSAPTGGMYAGILIFQDPSDAHRATINGVNTVGLAGALYFPTAQVTMDGGNCSAPYTILVAYTAIFNGSNGITCFNDNYSSLPNGSPIKAAVLVE